MASKKLAGKDLERGIKLMSLRTQKKTRVLERAKRGRSER